MAKAMRQGYKEIFARNEYAHELSKEKLKSPIVEMTGLSPADSTVNAIVGTFNKLKAYATFDGVAKKEEPEPTKITPPLLIPNPTSAEQDQQMRTSGGLNLSYTINLNLPETTDVEVFNAIFKSLRENLLRS